MMKTLLDKRDDSKGAKKKLSQEACKNQMKTEKDFNRDLDKRGTATTVSKEAKLDMDNKLTDMLCKNWVEMQCQKKFQVQSEKFEFLIKFEQEKINDLRADFKMADDDEVDKKKDLKKQIKEHQNKVTGYKMQWEEIRNNEEKKRDIVLVDWNTSIENDGVSAITTLETPVIDDSR